MIDSQKIKIFEIPILQDISHILIVLWIYNRLISINSYTQYVRLGIDYSSKLLFTLPEVSKKPLTYSRRVRL